jgi:hypothetical protein
MFNRVVDDGLRQRILVQSDQAFLLPVRKRDQHCLRLTIIRDNNDAGFIE